MLEKEVEIAKENLRKHLNRSIRWGWINVGLALVLVPLNLYFYIFGSHEPLSLVVAILWVALGAWAVVSLVTSYRKRWFHLGPNG